MDKKELIMIAIGQASMCWEHPDKAGTFNCNKAKEIGDKLYKDLFGTVAGISIKNYVNCEEQLYGTKL